jgi:phosphatidylglycerol lysyltransferase
MKRNLARSLGPVVAVVLFATALQILYREIRQHHYHEIAASVAAIPYPRLWLAVAFTVAGYLLLTGYDALALRHLGKAVPYRRVSLVSFIAYAMSHNIGFALLSGGTVRYRLYPASGLSGFEIAQVIGFCGATFWIGFLAAAGAVFLLDPPALPQALHLPFDSVRPIGILFIAILAAYLLLGVFWKRRVRVKDWEFALPTPGRMAAQIGVGTLDWLSAGAALFALLPPGIGFPHFMGVFLLAQITGLVSQVPGGLGVFETAFLVLLSGTAPAPGILGALLAYRAIYYLLPLTAAAVLLAGNEIVRQREMVRRAAQATWRWSASLAPSILALTTFLGGAVLLVSGATPAATGRMEWLNDFLPLPVIEMSHLLGSLAGIGLVLLARGLQQRLEAAWHMATALLTAGMVFSLLKGADYEEAILLAIMLAALLPARREFYRTSSLIGERFTLPWIAAVAVVLIGSIWIGIFSHKHLDYSRDLWWQITLSGDAPRFLRATLGAGVAVLAFAVARLMRPAPPEPAPPSAADLERVRAIVAVASETNAGLALLGDKQFLFSERGDAFIMYAVRGRSWVALGDPVGPEEAREELAWRFRELSDRHAGWTVFYEVGRRNLDLYVDLGLTIVKLGEEARIPLEGFSLQGSDRKPLRATVHRSEKEGCSFEVVPADGVPALLPEMRRVSDAWLAAKRVREKSFSLGRFDEAYLSRFPAALVRDNGRLVAFANVWLGADRGEISIDLMRYLPEAPPGVMEYLLVRLMLWGSQEGYRWFNLGMAPLSGLEARALAPRWTRFAAFVYRHGENFYNFQGLRQYKEKFHPVWEPRYLASPGGLALPRIVANLTALISGGPRAPAAR